MAKVDVSITRTLTLNLGNYESSKPTVTLTAKDVDADKVSDAYLALDKAATGLFKMEVLATSLEHTRIKKSGLQAYCTTVAQNREQIGENVEKSLVELESL
jgi:hypothetical protein